MKLIPSLAGVALAGAVAASPSLAAAPPPLVFPKQTIIKAEKKLITPGPIVTAPMFIFFRGPSATRPTLLGTAESTAASGDPKTLSVTAPTGCNLLVAFIGSRHAASSSTLATPTYNGNNMSVAEAWTQNTNRTGAGIYYYLNPDVGVARTLSFNFSSGPSNSWIHVWYFTGNTSDPIGAVSENSSTSANALTCTMDPETSLPYIVAGASHAHSSGSGEAWTATNLSIDNTASVAGNNGYGAGSDGTLTNPGSTGFTLDSPWTNSYISMSCVEIRAIGE